MRFSGHQFPWRRREASRFSRTGRNTATSRLTLLDTPGHVDFAAETERVLRVLDYAILVVSGTDGVQGHTETLWRLLARYGVPTFIFVNKCDAAEIPTARPFWHSCANA